MQFWFHWMVYRLMWTEEAASSEYDPRRIVWSCSIFAIEITLNLFRIRRFVKCIPGSGHPRGSRCLRPFCASRPGTVSERALFASESNGPVPGTEEGSGLENPSLLWYADPRLTDKEKARNHSRASIFTLPIVYRYRNRSNLRV